MIQISIITVGMNHLSYLKPMLASVYGDCKPETPFEMIYVDNCSTDGSVNFIKTNYPQVKIIVNTEPLGFGENNNRGVFASTGKYIAIINPDIVMHPGSLDNLFNFAENHPEVGITVPKLLNPDGTLQYSVRGFISLSILLARIRTKGNDKATDKEVDKYLCRNLDYSKTQTVDWAIGAAFFLSRNMFAELGGFDIDYFLYMEDEDICLRSWKLDKPVVYYPEALMTHNHLRGSSKLGKKTFLHLNSMKTFFQKHGFHVPSYRNKFKGLL